MGENQGEREPHLGKKKVGQSGSMGRRRRASKKNSLGGVGASMSGWVGARAFVEDLESLGLTQSLPKPEM